MLRLGLLGGMGWESSAAYYRLANELVREQRGGLHSAECLLYSADFAIIEKMQAEDRWDEAGLACGGSGCSARNTRWNRTSTATG
jgi:aspartate racemase